jgi:multidrug efflux pump subunit AcrA (membrane-fusion protein)
LPVKAGELVSPGVLVASVVNVESLEVKTFVDSELISNIRTGDAVNVGNRTEGVVSRISPSVNPETKKVEVVIAVNSPDESGLVVGQYVNLEINSGAKSINNGGSNTVYLIPLESIKTTPNGTYVYTVNINDEIVSNKIEATKIIGEKVQVISGISPDMKIIKEVRGLNEGQKIQILNND